MKAPTLFAVLILILSITALSATEFRSGNVVTISSDVTIDDEIYIAGGTLAIDGNITNDLMAAGGQISVRGNVSDSASIAGGTIDVSGEIGNNLRIIGGQVTYSGLTQNNASIIAGATVTTSDASIGEDLQIFGGESSFEGSIGGNLRVNGGEVTINAEVGGDVEGSMNRLIIGPNAMIQGDLVYSSPVEAQIADGAEVQGEIIHEPATPPAERPFAFWRLAWWVFGFLALFATAVIIIAIVPRHAERSADRILSAPWIALLLGFILLIVVTVLVILLMITVIGIPIAFILLAIYAIMVYLSRAFAGLAIGRWLFARFGRPGVSPYLALLVGLAILWTLFLIPVIGWIIHLAALLFGLGGLMVERYYLIKDLRREEKV